MFEIQERKTRLSEMSPYKQHVGLGVRSELSLKESEWLHELVQRSWNKDYDEDKYTLLVRLILWWVGLQVRSPC